ncbi:MAG: DUF4906 domain-containing protein, partial [Bacteroides sp.]|nr:DUF4906 domain-containing protein [Bacteroides sp.]
MIFCKINIWPVVSALLLAIAMTACQDDRLYDDSFIGEGESDLHATVSFIPLATGLDTRSSGTAIKSIKNLCIVIYKSNGEYYTQFMANDCNDYNYDEKANTGMPSDYKTNQPTTDYPLDKAESSTPMASFTFKSLPYGRYRIYAVANLGDLPLKVTESEESLKNHYVEWNEEDVAKNNAMFGYFTTSDNQTSAGFIAPDLLINQKKTDLHCWIKRTVSKVTVAFDPSGLKEAVSVYIRSVTIHDIPLKCKLGEDNEPKSLDDLIKDGECIYYGDGETTPDDYNGWLRLQKGSGVQGNAEHKEDDDALYFFENMQGDFEHLSEPERKRYLKVQIPEETGTPVNEPDEPWENDFKDRVRYGTYIEVIGYYVSQNADKLSKGPIKYRFMLGKNTTYNYDAQRNYHYKLTLKFRGWANEADWHIDYDEVTPTIFVPNPYYISYLYNQSLELPIRITGYEQLKDEYKLHAQIIENNWAPTQLSNDKLANEFAGEYDNLNGFAWNKWAYEHTYKNKNYAGFLSMRADQNPIVGQDQTYGQAGNEYLENNYLGKKRFYADYLFDEIGDDFPVSGEAISGTYDVIQTDKKSVTIKLPMFTRPKELIPSSDFSGNNPFYAYRRKAVVRFSLRPKVAPDPTEDATEDTYDDTYDHPFEVKDLKVKDDVEDKDKKYVKYVDITIYQVPRIVNPKAIWRKHDSTEPFHVQLLQLDGAGASSFSEFESEGPWRASILTDPDGLIELKGNGNTVTNASTGENAYIHGSSGTSVDFTYTPRGTCGANQTRCGIILVEYHDYTCNHLIFVRQGYDCGVELGGNMWSCYNAYATGSKADNYLPQILTSTDVVVTNSPLSIGSLFKRCNYNYAILESNCENYGWLEKISGNGTLLKTAYVDNATSSKYSTRDANWDDIQGFAWTKYTENSSRFETSWAENWTAVNKNNAKLTIPTYEDYKNLRDNCEYGYGVVYADGAGGVAFSVDEAFGFT